MLILRQIRCGKLFHEHNAPAHTSTVAMAAIQTYGFQFVEDPPVSPDLAPFYYYVFPKMKKEFGGHQTDDDVMNAVDNFLRE